MKKISIILSIFIIFSACKKLEDLNKNTKDPSTVTGESLFTGAQKRCFDEIVNTNVNYNIWRLIAQYWTETTYLDEVNYDLVTRTIPDDHWDRMYLNVLKNLDESKKVITATTYGGDASPSIKTNKLAIIEVMEVYAWSNLVETFGDIPYAGALDGTLYSEALNTDKPLPRYDNGLKIYKDLIARLNAAIAGMSGTESFGSADNMYGGDVTSWKKFATSLKLRMGMLLADCDPTFAQTTVEAAAADVSNLIQDNTENAKLVYASSQPNTNPLYEDLVASGRLDFVAANTIVDTMNNWNDPRLPYYFTQVDTSTTGTPKLAYVGGIYGESNDYYSYSHEAPIFENPTFEGTIFDYAEVEFLLAEAAARGFSVAGSAASHYAAGVTASIEYWGGSAADAATYLAQPNIAYNAANWKLSIGMQQWIAYYNRGFEAWTEWRKLDYPLLQPGPDALTAIPIRYTYPIEEQTLNGANYKAASAAIGGDAVDTRLFWDKY